MFDPQTNRFPYPLATDTHYLEVKKNDGTVFDKDYPYVDNSKKAKRKRAFTRFLLYTVVFPLARVRLGLKIEGRQNLKKHKEERIYHYDGAYKVDESYFELSSSGSDTSSLPTSAMRGEPPRCPYCGNKDLGTARCGKCHCMDLRKPHEVKCPWCGDVDDYEVSEFSLKGGRD